MRFNIAFPSRRLKMRRSLPGSILGAVLAGILAVPSGATTIQQKSLSDLVKGAELVFEGTVTGSTVEPGPNGQGLRTCFTFQVSKEIVGTAPANIFPLCFMGGELNGRRQVVSGMRYPTVGEHGIYLVESTHQTMANPLIGWDQGHYLIEPEGTTGAEHILTAARRRVTGLNSDAGQPTHSAAIFSPEGATAAGVESDTGPDLAGAMLRDDFESRLRSFVAR